MPIDAFTHHPPRMTITRLDDPTIVLEAQYNPEEVKEKVGASWSKQVVPGLSHQVKQFTNTENRRISFTMVFQAIPLGLDGTSRIRQVRRFFLSSVRPRRNVGSIASAGAPRLLFVWPEYMSLTATLESANMNTKRYNAGGPPIELSVEVELEEIRDTAIFADEIEREE